MLRARREGFQIAERCELAGLSLRAPLSGSTLLRALGPRHLNVGGYVETGTSNPPYDARLELPAAASFMLIRSRLPCSRLVISRGANEPREKSLDVVEAQRPE